MAIQLLATKFYIPPVRSEFVTRPNLVKRINDGIERKLTLISAPAGYGKTTLLSEWIQDCDRSVSWVSLDRDDNIPNRFWAYFITSINKSLEDIGVSLLTDLQSQSSPSSKALIKGLINEIVGLNPDPFAIVLDDYHVIENIEIHAAITYLIEYCPPSMHLVIATRADPQFPLGKWRTRMEMNELRTAELRFTSRETQLLFQKAMGLDLSIREIEALENRTEGWITGLQMAVISIKGVLETKKLRIYKIMLMPLQAAIDLYWITWLKR